MYKDKKTIEEEVEYLVLYKLNKDKTELYPNEMPEISNYIHQIRQDDLEAVKEMIKDTNINDGFETQFNKQYRQGIDDTKQNLLEKLNNLNK